MKNLKEYFHVLSIKKFYEHFRTFYVYSEEIATSNFVICHAFIKQAVTLDNCPRLGPMSFNQ